MSGMLPEGWSTSKLENCTEILDKFRKPISSKERNERIAGKTTEELYPYFGATGQIGYIDDFLIEGRFVLVGEDGAPFFDSLKNKAYIVDGKIWVNNHAHILKSYTDNSYLCHYLNQFNYNGYVSGTTRLKLTQGKLKEISVLIPPLNEQKRIVVKLDKIIPRIDKVKERLDKIPVIIKRFRQSVLTAAVTGKLTEEWREENPDVESAEDTICVLPKKLAENFLNVFEKTKSDELPMNWVNAPLVNIGEIRGGGTPSKSNVQFWKGNIPWISPKDMKIDRISNGKDFISKQAVEKSSTKLIPKGSILFVVRGMILAHTFPVAITQNEVTINQDMKSITPNSEIYSDYLFIVFKKIQYKVLTYVKEATHGTLRLEMPIIQTFAVPLPPLEEQKEIVRQVDKLFSLADKLEKHYQKAKAKVDKLSQSVLAKAFRGELVITEAELAGKEGRVFESAEELLKRIQKEREVLGAAKISKGKSKKKPVSKGGKATLKKVVSKTSPSTVSQNSRETQKKRTPKPKQVKNRFEKPDVLKAFRKAVYGMNEIDQASLLRLVGKRLDVHRVSAQISGELESYIKTAVQRKIISRDKGGFSPATPRVSHYEDDYLIKALCAVIKNGHEYLRAHAVEEVAQYLGFDRAGDALQEKMKSVFRKAIRRDLIYRNGGYVGKI